MVDLAVEGTSLLQETALLLLGKQLAIVLLLLPAVELLLAGALQSLLAEQLALPQLLLLAGEGLQLALDPLLALLLALVHGRGRGLSPWAEEAAGAVAAEEVRVAEKRGGLGGYDCFWNPRYGVGKQDS